MYKVNPNDNIHGFDVDDTLVFFDPIEGVEPIAIQYGPYADIVYPNPLEIASLKRAKVRGHFVRVHSQGGKDWAEAVVKALGLEDYVDEIETKTKWFHDDLPVNEWSTRIYQDPRKK